MLISEMSLVEVLENSAQFTQYGFCWISIGVREIGVHNVIQFCNWHVTSCSGPREDATRIGSAGVVRRQAVDISPLRRVNQAIYLLTTGARESAFRNIKTIAECLADELINAAKGSSNRYMYLMLAACYLKCRHPLKMRA
jgi:hypothetical protein